MFLPLPGHFTEHEKAVKGSIVQVVKNIYIGVAPSQDKTTADLTITRIVSNHINKFTIEGKNLTNVTTLKWISGGITIKQNGQFVLDSKHPSYTIQNNPSELTICAINAAKFTIIGSNIQGGGWEEPIAQETVILPDTNTMDPDIPN